MIETIRPTMSMVRDLLPGMKESWIFNDCAIGETKGGVFNALVMVRIDEGDVFYGFIPHLNNQIGLMNTRDQLDWAAETFGPCPSRLFDRPISWDNVKEGHRYA